MNGLVIVLSVLIAGVIATSITVIFKPDRRRSQRALDRCFHEHGLPGEPPQVAGTFYVRSSVPPGLYLRLLGYDLAYQPPPRTRPLGPHELRDSDHDITLVDPIRDDDELISTVLRLHRDLDPRVPGVLAGLRDDRSGAHERLRAVEEVRRSAEAVADGEARRGLARPVTRADVLDAYLDGYALAQAEWKSGFGSAEPRVSPPWYQAFAALVLPRHTSLAMPTACGYFHGRSGHPSAFAVLR